MKKALSVAAVSVLLVLFGCGEPEPEVETATLLEGQPDEFLAEPEPLAPDPVATETADPAPVPGPTPPGDTLPTTETAEGAPGELPRTHNIDLGGAMHAPGYDNPVRRCASCHGEDLRGGRRAESSCFDCHDQTWD
jgi:hypothetical protein